MIDEKVQVLSEGKWLTIGYRSTCKMYSLSDYWQNRGYDVRILPDLRMKEAFTFYILSFPETLIPVKVI